MTADMAKQLQYAWNAKHRDQVCLHSRMIEYLEPKNRRNAHYVVCRECGAMFPDPYTQFALGLSVQVA